MKNKHQIEELYLKYYPELMVYGKTLTTNQQLIEDTIQDLFLTLWQKSQSLMFKNSIENYIFISFRNNLIRKIKKEQTIRIKQQLFILPDSDNTFIEAKEEILNDFLQKLPARQKEVLFLRFYKNKSFLEIAELLGISYQVARNFSYRAIKQLKRKFSEIRVEDLSPFLLFLLHY